MVFDLTFTAGMGTQTVVKEHKIVTEIENVVAESEPFLRVSAGSNPQSVASAIAHALYQDRQVKLRAVGAGAVNQAVKALAIARGYVAPRGLDLTCKPGFTTIESRDGEISAIVFSIQAS